MRQIFPRQNDMVLVALSGASSSGKSVTSRALHKLFPGSILIHLDDFYYPDEKIPVDPASKELNWDCPEAIDYKKFVDHIKAIKERGVLDDNIDSLEIDPDILLSEDEEQILSNEIKVSQSLKYKRVVFVDGFMLFHSPEIISLFDVNLFFRASYSTLKTRRMNRQGYNTVAGFWVDPPDYFEKIVWPEYIKNYGYLFDDGDVNKNLNSVATNKYQIRSITNENISLFDLTKWAINEIVKSVG